MRENCSESNKRNARDKTLDLPLLRLYKRITSLINHISLAHGESLPTGFGSPLTAVFGLI